MREFPKGRVELVKIGGATIGRAIFEPGWRSATSVQPHAKKKSCLAPHFQYHVAGTLRVRMDDGQEFGCKPGDLLRIPVHAGPPFRSMPVHDSGACRATIPVHAGPPREGVIPAG